MSRRAATGTVTVSIATEGSGTVTAISGEPTSRTVTIDCASIGDNGYPYSLPTEE